MKLITIIIAVVLSQGCAHHVVHDTPQQACSKYSQDLDLEQFESCVNMVNLQWQAESNRIARNDQRRARALASIQMPVYEPWVAPTPTRSMDSIYRQRRMEDRMQALEWDLYNQRALDRLNW